MNAESKDEPIEEISAENGEICRATSNQNPSGTGGESQGSGFTLPSNRIEANRKNGLAAGASDYLTKPYMADIAATIRQNIEQNQ